tara:strand:+ start:2380 stop:4257 length:1878 start_codon:yes stop_codon:yes gene_type:complete
MANQNFGLAPEHVANVTHSNAFHLVLHASTLDNLIQDRHKPAKVTKDGQVQILDDNQWRPLVDEDKYILRMTNFFTESENWPSHSHRLALANQVVQRLLVGFQHAEEIILVIENGIHDDEKGKQTWGPWHIHVGVINTQEHKYTIPKCISCCKTALGNITAVHCEFVRDFNHLFMYLLKGCGEEDNMGNLYKPTTEGLVIDDQSNWNKVEPAIKTPELYFSGETTAVVFIQEGKENKSGRINATAGTIGFSTSQKFDFNMELYQFDETLEFDDPINIKEFFDHVGGWRRIRGIAANRKRKEESSTKKISYEDLYDRLMEILKPHYETITMSSIERTVQMKVLESGLSKYVKSDMIRHLTRDCSILHDKYLEDNQLILPGSYRLSWKGMNAASDYNLTDEYLTILKHGDGEHDQYGCGANVTHLVTGKAGSGKTALVNNICRQNGFEKGIGDMNTVGSFPGCHADKPVLMFNDAGNSIREDPHSFFRMAETSLWEAPVKYQTVLSRMTCRMLFWTATTPPQAILVNSYNVNKANATSQLTRRINKWTHIYRECSCPGNCNCPRTSVDLTGDNGFILFMEQGREQLKCSQFMLDNVPAADIESWGYSATTGQNLQNAPMAPNFNCNQ